MEIQELDTLPRLEEIDVDDPHVREVGEGVYHLGLFRFESTNFHRYGLTLADNANGHDWRDTRITVAMTIGGGNNGRDHWGWPEGQGFAAQIIDPVSDIGIFGYWLEDVGTSPVLAGVFRWIRQGFHGASARMWLHPTGLTVSVP